MHVNFLKTASAVSIVTAIAMLGGAQLASAAAGPVNRPFPGGEISQLVINDGPTQGSAANLTYTFDACGKSAGETTCTWRLDLDLAPESNQLCPSTLQNPAPIWSSGPRNGNGQVESGPIAFSLRGTPGQVLCAVLQQTQSGESGGLPFTQGGSTVLSATVMGPDLVSPVEALELQIIRANPPAAIDPPPVFPHLAVSADCSSLTVGTVRYAFAFHQIGCRKATNLALMVHVSGRAPSGYRCTVLPGDGLRCSRQGHPRKYVEWHLPRRPQAGIG
jgi:hypothetical protein